MSQPTLRLGKLSEFREQQVNANKHTPRGMGLLDAAMHEDGYVAPMTAAADGEVIDGSARLETSAITFEDEAIIVSHDGTRPIVMERVDIPSATEPRAKRISLRANRIAQLNLDFDVDILQAQWEELDLTPLWSEEEFQKALHLNEEMPVTAPTEFASYDENIETQYQCPKCKYEWSGKPK
jgi:hypothetical protein